MPKCQVYPPDYFVFDKGILYKIKSLKNGYDEIWKNLSKETRCST